MATFGNPLIEPPDWVATFPALRPLMKIWSWPGPADAVATLGKYRIKSSRLVTFSCCRDSPVNAWIAIGTSWTFSVRRCAVTTTSWIPAAPAVAGCYHFTLTRRTPDVLLLSARAGAEPNLSEGGCIV